MPNDFLPPSLMEAVRKLDVLGETSDWSEFAMVGHYNTMRHLARRGLFEDANVEKRATYVKEYGYTTDQPLPYEAFPPRYRLTEKGRSYLTGGSA